jgi:hypothetical protein
VLGRMTFRAAIGDFTRQKYPIYEFLCRSGDLGRHAANLAEIDAGSENHGAGNRLSLLKINAVLLKFRQVKYSHFPGISRTIFRTHDPWPAPGKGLPRAHPEAFFKHTTGRLRANLPSATRMGSP